MKMKSKLDERQEMALAKIESRGCWIAFWGLLAVMAIQAVFYDFDPKSLAGEWIVFMILCIYISGACVKEGIWSRSFEPSAGSNALFALGGGVGLGIIVGASKYLQYPEAIGGCVATGLLVAGFTFILCFIALSVSAKSYTKRKEEMEAEPEEEEE